ncbi:MAG: hypothetical protein D6719_10775 [Candidatus Dadabacteria bacterium]|nr:MAG: hypothetical protein D6719_10775 [Candidatus Dadabacteria bacterium]
MPQNNNIFLGIWDGHDAGAALIKDGKVLGAVNEERLSRRKLDAGFPSQSINYLLGLISAREKEKLTVCCSTYDFAKTITRIFPSLKEEYYLLRRRKKPPGKFSASKKLFKYYLTEIKGNWLTRLLSTKVLRNELKKIGINNALHIVNHHLAHAASAAFTSGYERTLVVTVDGIGDAESGSIWKFENGLLTKLSSLPGHASLGIFFEHVTNLLNMRELEDEGKVMALANYAFPVPDNQNPLKDLIQISGLKTTSTLGGPGMYYALKKILWSYPSEQFACMAQRVLEMKLIELIKNAVNISGINNVAYAGGVASNVKANMLIEHLPEVNKFYVFPHMGDGGLALGAALAVANNQVGLQKIALPTLALGPEFSDKYIETVLTDCNKVTKLDNNALSSEAAGLIASGEIIFWFQGRMEYGPRALGQRSILARPDSVDIKNRLNLILKKRVWYQPFCPSLLYEDAIHALENFSGTDNFFMTTAFKVTPGYRDKLAGVMNVDFTCRPHLVTERDDSRFLNLLYNIKKMTEVGAVLNTSLNLHGEPLVCSPQDAVKLFMQTDINYMFIGSFLVSKK